MTQIVQKSQPQKWGFFSVLPNTGRKSYFRKHIKQNAKPSIRPIHWLERSKYLHNIMHNILDPSERDLGQGSYQMPKKLPNAAESYQIPSYQFPCYQIPRYRIPLQVTKYLATKLPFNYQLPNPASQCYQIPQSNLSGRFQVTI